MVDRPELARLRRRTGHDAGGRLSGVGEGFGGDDRRDRPVRGAAVDHEQAGLDRGSVLGVGARRKGQPQDDAAARRQAAHRRRVLEQTRRHDGCEAAAVGQAGQRRLQVGLEVLEGRVDQGDVERARGLQHVRQVDGVVLGTRREGEEALQQG